MIQLYVYLYICIMSIILQIFSIIDYYKISNIVPCTMQ